MSEKRVERRLAAILATDVAGYSRLMGADEEGTHARLTAHLRELIDPKIREHNGRTVKTTGDGMLAEFASVVDAVRCAAEFQRAMVDRESTMLEDRRIRFRVGINLGDIIVEGDDIFGDGVNIAARLEAMAEPGGICISRTVRNQIRDKLPYPFEDMGEQSVKNIARPVRADAMSAAAVAATPLVAMRPRPGLARRRAPQRAFLAASLVGMVGIAIAAWWAWPNTETRPASPQSSPAAGIEAKPAPRLSIVVLPFANLSSDAEKDYFVDSITDDLTTDLSRIQDSCVIARSTAFTYKGKYIDVKQIGRELGVRYVLEGSARRLGEQVQVNVQLIDAETGAHVWADRFDTDRANLAKAQSEITGRLAWTLKVQLVRAAGRQIDQKRNPDARDLVMRGWASYNRPISEAQLRESQRAFEQALELDPGSVDAKIGLATVLIRYGTVGFSKSSEPDLARAGLLLREALERDDSDARAHFAMGWLHRIQNHLNDSKIEFEKALALDPNYVNAMTNLCWTLIGLGEPEACIPHGEKAIRLDPEQSYARYAALSSSHLLLGHANEAVDFARKARAANPRVYYVHWMLAAALGYRGDLEEAKAALTDFLRLKPEFSSLAKLRKGAITGTPDFDALAEKTVFAGLRRAGLPDE